MGNTLNIQKAKKVETGKREGRDKTCDIQEIEIELHDGSYFNINIFFD